MIEIIQSGAITFCTVSILCIWRFISELQKEYIKKDWEKTKFSIELNSLQMQVKQMHEIYNSSKTAQTLIMIEERVEKLEKTK